MFFGWSGAGAKMGIKNRLLAMALSRFPSLSPRIAEKVAPVSFGEPPWAPLRKPLSGARLLLVTTAGVHLKGDEPFDMSNTDGDPVFRVIPPGAAAAELAITHDYYDHADADRDINIVFPVDRLRELAAEGRIGSLSARFFGFMGHITEPLLDKFVNETIPEMVRMALEDGADAALVTPG